MITQYDYSISDLSVRMLLTDTLRVSIRTHIDKAVLMPREMHLQCHYNAMRALGHGSLSDSYIIPFIS